MITFLPYSDYRKTALVLDTKRLGRQRVETLQIAHALRYGSEPHIPGVKMWLGHGYELCQYGLVLCEEWWQRANKENCADLLMEEADLFAEKEGCKKPAWLGNPLLHFSHQANLKRKNPDYYSRFFPEVDPRLPYFWPVR